MGPGGTGKVTIHNLGPPYPNVVNVVMPYYALSIYDAHEKRLFRAIGGWGGGMAHDATFTLRFDTHSNTLPEFQGKDFLFPEPGEYLLKMELFPGGDLQDPIAAKNVQITVPAAR